MKHLKRILSILLVLTMMCSLWGPAYAVEGDGVKLSMTASQSTTKVGETVVLTIQSDRDFTTRGSGMTLYYDAEKLEPDLDSSSAAAPLQIIAVTVGGKAAVRVSFMPGLEPATFSAAEPLAQICFKALAVTGQTSISMGAAYLYDDLLTEIVLEKPAAVNLTIDPAEVNIPVTGISLNKTELTLEEGELEALKATIEPIGASDPTVIWASSDETVAVVSGGVVKGLSSGTATITATTQDGGFTASCTVTVTAPNAGYTVKMPADTTTVIGGTVQIPVVISNEDGKTGYNAFDISFTYDPGVLELVSTEISGVTVTTENGKINVMGYGEDRAAGSVPFTLEFKALKLEATEVKITSARVDNSGNTVVKNASLANLIDGTTAITVTGYPVTLPEGFLGESTAIPGEDYTFTEPDDYYDYTVRVTVDGKEVTVTKNNDGSYTIPAELVIGEIIVTATKTGKTFNVTLGTDMAGSATAQYGTDYVATINRDESYRYTVTVTIGGKDYTGYAASGKTYTIPGEDITGEIVFKVEKTLIVPVDPPGPTDPTNPSDPSDPTKPTKPVTYYKVTFTGSGAGAAQGNATSITKGGTYTLTLKKQAGCNYTVSYKMGGKAAVAVSPNANGKYTISNVTGDLEIIIEKSLAINVSIQEFVTLDEKSVFLILADAALANASSFTYDGNVMYYSEAYGAWAYLVITDQDLTLDQVRSQVKISTQNNRVLTVSAGDVDGNGKVNWNDAQLVRDLYNAKYGSFDSVNMGKYLLADVNADHKVDIRDVVWIACKIWESEGASA